jgi:hypothetical protein
MKNVDFWDVMPFGTCNNRSFGGTYRLHHQCDKNRRARNNGSSNQQRASVTSDYKNILDNFLFPTTKCCLLSLVSSHVCRELTVQIQDAESNAESVYGPGCGGGQRKAAANYDTY